MIEYGLGIRQDIVIPETQNGKALLHKEVITPLIIDYMLRMLPAVELNDYFGGMAKKIGNVILDGNLPAELAIKHVMVP